MRWYKFKDKMPSREGFYAIKSETHPYLKDIEYIFMSEIGQNSFGSCSPKGFIYKYHDGKYNGYGPYTHWRFMTESEKYNFYDQYLRNNGLIGLHNLKSYNNCAINPYKDFILG